ncbi:unnamed protein product [Lymnaea stagnalis]|uniref:Macro domain-containing protein n=1 Tax=Lymnaea stagnalis TaxID=6523 RepID=A0AAV2H1M4_LYMST
MFLSHTKQKMNVMVELMKSKIKLTTLNEGKLKAKDCSSSDHQNLMEPSDSGNTRKSFSEDEKITNEVYCFKHSFILWLLHTLNFRSTVAEMCPTLTLNLDVLGLKVLISGQAKEVHAVKQCLKEEDDRISYNEDEEIFLQNGKILQQIEKTIKSDSMHLVLSDNLECFVIDLDDHQISLKKLASHFVVIRECLTLPSARFQDMLQWKELVESLHSKHPYHQISVDGTKVMILTLNDRDEMETNEIEKDLNQFILNNDEQSFRQNIPLAIRKDSSCEKEQYDNTFLRTAGHSRQHGKYGKSHNKSQGSDFIEFLPFCQQQIQYCNMFLQQELQNILETFKSAEITIQCDGIELKASSEHCGYEMKQRMKSLFDRIINVKKELKYPGLVSFFNSEDGHKLISLVSTRYECFIEPPMDGYNKTNAGQEVNNTGLEVLKPEDERINYQVTLLGTAKCPGFKVHLVQGNIRDIKSDVKVEFCISSTAQECIFKANQSSRDMTVLLPRWKAPEMSAYEEHFHQLRNSLRSVVGIVLDQLKSFKSTNVTFHINVSHDQEFLFPLDAIAKIVTEQLFAAFTAPSDSSKDIDVYICEPKCESVFKGFSYFIKRMGVDFGAPDQVSWDQICHRDFFKYPDYRQYKYDVEIVSSCPENLEFRNLFCYPIQPSLEASSCPVYFDPTSCKRLVENSLEELLKEMPDGLLIGDVHPVSCFPFSRDALVYCIPEWGSGIYQALKASLKNIFKQSYKYDAIIITPPGLGVQKFPLPYLVQTFVQLLDEIIKKENSVRKKKIYLVVHNTEYKMAFERELQKRFPKIAKKPHFWWSLPSFWDSSDKKEQNGRASSPCTDPSILISKVVSLPIKYWGKSREKINMAHRDIERELQRFNE